MIFEERRNFIKKLSLLSATLSTGPYWSYAKESPAKALEKEDPWYKTATRWGQTNITEIDVDRYDISWWRAYWKKTKIDGVIVNAGGIVSYYPSKVPFHRPAEFLGGRDLFGELCEAAHQDGLAVFARMDSNRAHREFYEAHPDWFTIDKEGNPYMAGDQYITCVNGPYYDRHIPAILEEIITLYSPEGFTDNRWVGLTRDKICYCTNCKEKFRERTGFELPLQKDWEDKAYQEWILWNYARRLEIWDFNNQVTKKFGGPDCIWSGMNSGSLREQCETFRDYREIGARADILMLDYQTRDVKSGFQHNGEIGKLIHGLMGWDKLIPESMSLYLNFNWRPTFRLSSQPALEARSWMYSGIAGGIQPWWHHVSAYHEDRRMYNTAAEVFDWHKENENYLINRKPIANVGVVWSQRNQDFFGRDHPETIIEEPWRGCTHALTRARIPYLPLHVDQIADQLEDFSVLILPNLGILSEEQASAIRAFVENGGSLMVTGFCGLFDERGKRRKDFLLADLMGVHATPKHDYKYEENRAKASTKHTYLRLVPELRREVDGPSSGDEPEISGKRHEILEGFNETDILPFGGMLEPVEIEQKATVLMTFVPEFPVFPPEMAWMRTPVTDIPGLVVNETPQGGKVVTFLADIDRRFSRDNIPDHGALLENVIRWSAGDTLPMTVEGPGLIECHLYSQNNLLILHLINLSNAATWRHPVEERMPIGPIKIKIKVPGMAAYTKASLKVANRPVKLTAKNDTLELEIESISSHEMLVIS